MTIQHVKLALREASKQKLSFLIAILGMAISFAAVAHLLSYSLYYLNYDRQVDNPQEWYRLRLTELHPDFGELNSSGFFVQTAGMLLKDIPEVSEYLLYDTIDLQFNLSCDDKPFPMNQRTYVTQNFSEHYKLKIVYGNPDSIFANPRNLILSQSYATRLFGDVNPVGKEVFAGPRAIFQIAGVFADLPENLHLRNDIYSTVDYESDNATEDEVWYWLRHVRVRIPDREAVAVVQSKLDAMLAKYQPLMQRENPMQVRLDPITKIHFTTGLRDDAPAMSILIVYAVLALGLIILIAALFNFLMIISLSWQKRNDEFYFRRALGAGRFELFVQMAWEYAVYFFISVLLSIGLYAATLGIFNDLVQIDTLSYALFRMPYLAYTGGALVLLGTISGILMSWRHARIKLDQPEWHQFHKHRGNQVLLCVQMIISFALISMALSVTQQYAFIRNWDWGWDGKNTVQYCYLTLPNSQIPGYYDSTVLRQRIREIPGVLKESASRVNTISTSLYSHRGFFEVPILLEDSSQHSPSHAYRCSLPPDFFRTRAVTLLAGTVPDHETDTEVLINDTFARQYFGSQSPLGKKLRLDIDEEADKWSQIVGVVPDLRFFPAHQEMVPIIYHLKPMVYEYYQVSWKPGHKQQVLSSLEELFADVVKQGMLGYTSQEVEHAQVEFYAQDRIYMNLSLSLALFVVLLAMMGIYAVSYASIYAQMKDISIRKVCGAEFSDLIRLYFKKYLYLFLGSGFVGLILAFNLARLYADRFSVKATGAWLSYPLTIIIMAFVVFLPLYINILKAYKADAIRYLQAD